MKSAQEQVQQQCTTAHSQPLNQTFKGGGTALHPSMSAMQCGRCGHALRGDNRHRGHRDGGGGLPLAARQCQVQGDSREEAEHTHVWGGGVKVMSRSLHSAKKIGIFKYIQGLQDGTCRQV